MVLNADVARNVESLTIKIAYTVPASGAFHFHANALPASIVTAILAAAPIVPNATSVFVMENVRPMTTINRDVLMESAGWILAFAVQHVMVPANAHGKYVTSLLVYAANFALVHATVHSATPALASVPATIWKTMKPTRLKGRPFLQIISVGKAMCLA